jgi:hypothetical protein
MVLKGYSDNKGWALDAEGGLETQMRLEPKVIEGMSFLLILYLILMVFFYNRLRIRRPQ